MFFAKAYVVDSFLSDRNFDFRGNQESGIQSMISPGEGVLRKFEARLMRNRGIRILV